MRFSAVVERTNAIEQTSNPYIGSRIHTDGAMFVVYRQPMALDRFAVHDVRPSDTSGVFWDYVETSSEAQMSVDSEMYTDWCLPHIYDDCSPTSNPRASNLLFGCVSAATVLKNAFVLVQVNRFQQIIGVFTLQAPSYGNKATWLSRLHDAQENYREACRKLDGKRLSTADGDAGTSGTGGVVDINVLQCDEASIAFVDPSADITGAQQNMASFGGPVGGGTLLGVPRTDAQQSPVFTDQTSRSSTRTFRSSSSDAASTLQQDYSNPTSPSNDEMTLQVRRTSDPLCGGAASGQRLGDHVEIVISSDPHDPGASMTSVNSSGSSGGGSTSRLAPGHGLAPPSIWSATHRSSATSLCYFPSSAYVTSGAATTDRSPPPSLTQSVSACSLNRPSALFNASLMSAAATSSVYCRQPPTSQPRFDHGQLIIAGANGKIAQH